MLSHDVPPGSPITLSVSALSSMPLPVIWSLQLSISGIVSVTIQLLILKFLKLSSRSGATVYLRESDVRCSKLSILPPSSILSSFCCRLSLNCILPLLAFAANARSGSEDSSISGSTKANSPVLMPCQSVSASKSPMDRYLPSAEISLRALRNLKFFNDQVWKSLFS